MKFLREIFQDVDGAFSSKRTAFFIFVLMFAAVTAALYFHGVSVDRLPFVQSTQDKLTDLIKWLGGFIVGEQAVKFAPAKKETP